MIVGLVPVEPAAPQHELSPPFTGIGTWNGPAAPRPQANVQGSELKPNSRHNRASPAASPQPKRPPSFSRSRGNSYLAPRRVASRSCSKKAEGSALPTLLLWNPTRGLG